MGAGEFEGDGTNWVPGGVVSRNDERLATSAAGRLDYVAEVGTYVRVGERIAKLEGEAVRRSRPPYLDA